MKNLSAAMLEEKSYIDNRLNGIESALSDRLATYGYSNLSEYFKDKRDYLFNQWIPEVYPIDVRDITTGLEDAIRNKKYGVYISYTDGLYAFHGSDEIDYELCEELGVYVAELYHQGGTIIGSERDLGIEIVAPNDIGLDAGFILNKFCEIIGKYVSGEVIIDGNDILINDKKVMGSMRRVVGNVFVWAAQISFYDYKDVISQVCTKASVKEPSYIDSSILSRDLLESEVLAWLQKQ